VILLLDDEGEYSENLLSSLRSLQLEVTFISNVDLALKYLEQVPADLEVIVCDSMMPHGEAFTALETRNNLITGLRFAEKVRAMGITLPIVITTYLEENRVPIESLAERCAPSTIIRKKDKFSFEIAEAIRDLVKKDAND
jgi:CheY-like chemotaxis protein